MSVHGAPDLYEAPRPEEVGRTGHDDVRPASFVRALLQLGTELLAELPTGLGERHRDQPPSRDLRLRTT